MTKTTRIKRAIKRAALLGLLGALISQALWAQSVTANQPEPTDIVVWTVNTGLNSQNSEACAALVCKWPKFSEAVNTKSSCPDIVLGQEIRSIADADAFKAELDQISTTCGIYRRHFYDGGVAEKMGKVAIGWRAARFVHAQVNGTWDVYNRQERSGSSCTALKDGDKPSRWVTAVRLLDQNIPGKSVIAASIHWDNALTVECMHDNLKEFANGIQNRWGSAIPVVMGGDHNKRNAEPTTVADQRRETTLRPWYTDFTSTGYLDAIKPRYTTLDTNGDGNSDICEQWTYHQIRDLDHANKCTTDGQYRIDYTWYKGMVNTQAFTDKGFVWINNERNFYSDHRAIVSQYTY